MSAPLRSEIWLVDLGMVAKVRPCLTVPHAKLVRRLGILSAEQLAAVEHAVAFWLGLDSEST